MHACEDRTGDFACGYSAFGWLRRSWYESFGFKLKKDPNAEDVDPFFTGQKLDMPMPHDPSDKWYRRPVLTNGPCDRENKDNGKCNADLSDEYWMNNPTQPAVFDARKRQLDACAKLTKENGAPAVALYPRVTAIRAVGV